MADRRRQVLSSLGVVGSEPPSAVLLLLALVTAAHPAGAQYAGNGQRRAQVAGTVTLTSRGLSLLPALTLRKPAAMVDVAITDGDLSFEPQFRLGVDRKPWSFIFWGRYRPLRGEKFHLGVGAHPAIVFRTITVSIDGVQRDVIRGDRYLAGELSPSYSLVTNLTAGAYYLYAHGVEKDAAVKNTQFFALRANLANVRISDGYFIQFAPQLYYLRMDSREGVYLNSGLTLAKRKLPLSISAMVNQTIRTRIAAGEDFLWNVSFSYSTK